MGSQEVEEKLQALGKIFKACLSEIDKNCRLAVNLDEGSQTLKIFKVNDNNREAINNFLQTAFEHCKDIEQNENGCIIC